MKASLLNKLEILQDRFEELTALLGDAEVISDQTRFRAYSCLLYTSPSPRDS